MHEAQDQGATWLFCRRISLIDLGPQLSRQLLGCILAHRPIYIQHGLHQAIGIPCVTHTSILPIPTHRVGTISGMWWWPYIFPPCTQGKGILPHRNRSTRCSQFTIIQLKSATIEYLPLPAKPLLSFPALLPRSRNEPKPSVTVRKGTHAHASLVVVLSPLF